MLALERLDRRRQVLEDRQRQLLRDVDFTRVLEEHGQVDRQFAVLHATLFRSIVDVNVCFVDDLLLDDFFDDILKGNKSNCFVKWITISRSIYILKGKSS